MTDYFIGIYTHELYRAIRKHQVLRLFFVSRLHLILILCLIVNNNATSKLKTSITILVNGAFAIIWYYRHHMLYHMFSIDIDTFKRLTNSSVVILL